MLYQGLRLIEKMKILLLGATGRTGKLVLQSLLKSGYEVNCLARNSERILPTNGDTIFEGNASKSEDLLRAIRGCEHVISVLNISRKSDFPWSKLRTPKNYLSDVMGKLIPISERENVKRIVVCSAWGVAETKNDIPKWFKWFIDNSNVGAAYQDHERQEKLITDSKLDWTIVRPVGLTNSMKNETIKEPFGSKPNLTISRHRLAKYLADSLNNEKLIEKKIVISKE